MSAQSLIATLETQLRLLEEFFSLLDRETRELSDIHLDAMAEINNQKEVIATRIEKHLMTVRSEMEAIAISEGFSSKATLGELAERLKKKGIRDVAILHGQLNITTDRIRQAISINSEIAERFAASVTSSLGLLSRVINQSTTYGASGGYQQRPTGAVLINREA